jgi:hypothetical protein
MRITYSSTKPSSSARIVDTIVCVLLAVAFVVAGGAKLAGAPPMVAIFESIGVGQWFRLLTGVLPIQSLPSKGTRTRRHEGWAAKRRATFQDLCAEVLEPFPFGLNRNGGSSFLF